MSEAIHIGFYVDEIGLFQHTVLARIMCDGEFPFYSYSGVTTNSECIQSNIHICCNWTALSWGLIIVSPK